MIHFALVLAHASRCYSLTQAGLAPDTAHTNTEKFCRLTCLGLPTATALMLPSGNCGLIRACFKLLISFKNQVP